MYEKQEIITDVFDIPTPEDLRGNDDFNDRKMEVNEGTVFHC